MGSFSMRKIIIPMLMVLVLSSFVMADISCSETMTRTAPSSVTGSTFKVTYTVSNVNGTLYVNPYGNGTKAVRPVLECVEEVTDNGSGFTFLAHFSYENKNKAAVFVLHGENNFLSGGGVSNSLQPELFLSGGGNFDVYFDGTKLTWTISSLENGRKASRASDASSSSQRCPSYFKSIVLEAPEEELVQNIQDLRVYPNPVVDKVTISLKDMPASQEVMVFDIQGRAHSVRSTWHDINGLEIDMTSLNPGFYIIKVNMGESFETFRIIKQ